MSLQTIIDNATFLNINKRRVVASSISRSGHYKTAERSPSPYSFTVGAPQGFTYSTNRGVLEDLDSTDRITEVQINIGATNSALSYLTDYQGSLNSSQVGQISLNSVSGANIYLDTTSVSGSPSGDMFKKGDFILLEGNTSTYRYPYQVTSDIAFSGGNVTIPVHRPVLSQTGVALTSGGIAVGNNVTFQVKCVNMPTYTVVPHDLVEFSDNFEFIEVII